MLNVIAVMGRMVADPELRKTTNGVSTTTFTIACDRNFVKQGAERQADFLEIVAWRATAEFVCKYFLKGQLIAVNGSLQTRSYEDREGKKRKVFEIVADNVHFAEGKQGGGQQAAAQAREPVVRNNDDFSLIDDSEDIPF